MLLLQIKGTVLLMPNGSDLVTTAPLQTIKSDKKVGLAGQAQVSVLFRALHVCMQLP